MAQGKLIAVYTSDKSIYKSRVEANGYGGRIEDLGMVDNLMVVGPTDNSARYFRRSYSRLSYQIAKTQK